MDCPECHKPLDPKGGVVSTVKGWMHPRCAEKHARGTFERAWGGGIAPPSAPPPSFIEPSPDDEALVGTIEGMLLGRFVELNDVADKLARDISQVLLSRFHITKRT